MGWSERTASVVAVWTTSQNKLDKDHSRHIQVHLGLVNIDSRVVMGWTQGLLKGSGCSIYQCVDRYGQCRGQQANIK